MRRALTSAQMDRACGVLLAAACGDALGAGYEFGSASSTAAGDDRRRPRRVRAGGVDRRHGAGGRDRRGRGDRGRPAQRRRRLTSIAQRFADWYADGPPGRGHPDEPGPHAWRAAARPAGGCRRPPLEVHRADRPQRRQRVADADRRRGAGPPRRPRTPGRGRHGGQRADPPRGPGAGGLRAVVPGDPARGAHRRVAHSAGDLLPSDCRTRSGGRTSSRRPSGASRPRSPRTAGSSARCRPRGPRSSTPRCRTTSLPAPARTPWRTAIAIGHDTDTVAAIAGAAAGGALGRERGPAEWRRILHGWPGRRAQELVELAALTVHGGRPDRGGWPGVERMDYVLDPGFGTCVPHPHDDGVWIGGMGALDDLPGGVDAVVTLCRYGSRQVPPGLEHVAFRLIDTDDGDNPNLDFVIDDAARTVARLRDEGRTVLLHCVAAHSRTPTVAARYAVLRGRPPERRCATSSRRCRTRGRTRRSAGPSTDWPIGRLGAKAERRPHQPWKGPVHAATDPGAADVHDPLGGGGLAAAQGQARPDDVVLANRRLTDEDKDHEADLVVLMPEVGIVVLEVKGGSVSYDGEVWSQRSGGGRSGSTPSSRCVRQVRDPRLRRRGPALARRRHVAWAHGVVAPYSGFPDDFAAPDCPRWAVHGRDDRASGRHGSIDNGLRAHRASPPRRTTRSSSSARSSAGVGSRTPTERGGRGSSGHRRPAHHGTGHDAEGHPAAQPGRGPRRRRQRQDGARAAAGASARRRPWRRPAQRVALLCYSLGLGEYLKREVATWGRKDQPAYVGTFPSSEAVGRPRRRPQDSEFWEHRLPDRRWLTWPTPCRTGTGTTPSSSTRRRTSRTPGGRPVLKSPARRGGGRAVRLLRREPADLRPLRPAAGAAGPAGARPLPPEHQQIHEAFGPLAPSRMYASGGDGPAVRFVPASPQDAIGVADDEVDALLEAGWRPENVCLLTTGHRHPVQIERTELPRPGRLLEDVLGHR